MRTHPAALATTAAAAALAFGFLPTDVVRAEAVTLTALSLPQLNSRLIELRDEANAAQARADAESRDLTDDEQRDIEQIFAAFQATEDEIERREAATAAGAAAAQAAADATPQPRKTAPERLPGEARAASPTEWRDINGRPVHALANTAKVASVMPKAGFGGRANDGPPRLAAIIASAVDGQWERRGLNPRNSQVVGVGADGGFMVDSRVSAEIIDLARAASVVVQAGVRTIPMNTHELQLVRVAEDPQIEQVPEGERFPKTDARFNAITLKARKFGCIVPISKELLEDAPNSEEVMRGLLATAMASAIDNALLFNVGPDGVGLFAANQVQDLPVTGSAPNLDYDDFIDAIALVEAANGRPNAAIFNSNVKKRLAKLKDSQGNYLTPPADFVALNRLVSNKLSNSQSLVGDFTQMLMGVRVGVQFQVSDQGEAFERDEVWLKVRWRGDFALARPQHFVRMTGIALGT